MEKLFTLLELQRRSQEARSLQAFAHIIVNETHKLISYKQALSWRADGLMPVLEKVSGNVVLDPKGPYAIKIKDKIANLIATPDDDLVKNFVADDGSHVALLLFKTPEDGLMGGLWLENDTDFSEPDLHILEELSMSYAHALGAFAAA